MVPNRFKMNEINSSYCFKTMKSIPVNASQTLTIIMIGTLFYAKSSLKNKGHLFALNFRIILFFSSIYMYCILAISL